jgi:hypothetical protein
MPLITCPDCGKEISTAANACPSCGRPMAAPAVPLPSPAPSPRKRGCLRAFLVIVGILVFFYIVGSIFGPSGSTPSSSPTPSEVSSPAAPEATPKASSISWSEVDAIYNLRSGQTDLQKDEQWKRFKGQRIMWSGKVSEISDGWTGLTLQVKMNPHTLTFDVLVRLKKSEKEKAARLRKGAHVAFSGTLDTWGSLLPVTLKDGALVSPFEEVWRRNEEWINSSGHKATASPAAMSYERPNHAMEPTPSHRTIQLSYD